MYVVFELRIYDSRAINIEENGHLIIISGQDINKLGHEPAFKNNRF